MPITIALTAVPAKFIHEDGSDKQTLIIRPFGKKYGISIYFVGDMQGIKDAVARFAQQVHTQFPHYSFTVTVRVRRGDTPPGGFEQALRSGELGQHRFTSVFAHCAPGQGSAEHFITPD